MGNTIKKEFGTIEKVTEWVGGSNGSYHKTQKDVKLAILEKYEHQVSLVHSDKNYCIATFEADMIKPLVLACGEYLKSAEYTAALKLLEEQKQADTKDDTKAKALQAENAKLKTDMVAMMETMKQMKADLEALKSPALPTSDDNIDDILGMIHEPIKPRRTRKKKA